MKKKKKSKAVEWYIKGEYHCDKCPFCFGGEYLPGCNDYEDAGCYIFGDLRDTCRLIPPIRFVLGWGKRKKSEYLRAHEYDDFGEWQEKRYFQEQQFNACFKEHILNHYAVFYKDRYGNVFGEPIDSDWFCEFDEMMRLRWDCKDIFSPPSYVPLKKRWAQLIRDTWNRFIGIFKPYFCK